MAKIRNATPLDLAAVCELGEEVNAIHHASWPQVFAAPGATGRDQEHWARSVQATDAETFVAEEGEAIVGFITVSIGNENTSLFQPVRYSRVGTVGVKESCRSKGIGRSLMESAEEWGSVRGATEIGLTVWAFNEVALQMYKELGYEIRSHILGKRLAARAA